MAHEIVPGESQRHLQEEESSSIFKKVNRPITLKFDNIEYSVKVGGGGPFWKKEETKEKQILKGISGAVYPGEMLALLGPSGSGKTTLLTTLGGRLESGHLRGSITFNDNPYSSEVKRQIGFVTQDDVLYPHLTVRETLVYTALLRLPNTISKQEKIVLAQTVMSQLGLTRCKDSIIGQTGVKRGVSGGERKRVSIGQEMLINPSVLFLDEPTSGLDSTTAQLIVSTLRELVDGGRTIAMTIHQPSSKLFYMFHKVLLLSEGNPLYFGKGSDVMDYFESVGYKPQVTMNPADFLLDLANGIHIDESQDDVDTIKANLVEAYRTNLVEKVKGELLEGYGHSYFQDDTDDKKYGQWPTTWWQQFSVLIRRGMKEKKHEAFDTFRIAQVLIVSLLTGLVWFQCPSSNLKDQAGLIFHITGFWAVMPMFEALFAFPPERQMLEKERASGMYRLSAFFVSVIASDLPMALVLPTIFVIIAYFMAGLKYTAFSFIYFLFTVLIGVLVGQGMGLAAGAAMMDLKIASTLVAVICLAFSLLGGYFVNNIPAFISWIKYLSINHYTFKLAMGSQYKHGETYSCGDGKLCLVEEFPSIKPIGLDGQKVCWIALLAMVVGYRILAYIALMRMGRSKVKSN